MGEPQKATVSDEKLDAVHSFFVLAIGSHHLAVRAAYVDMVIQWQTPTPLPLTPLHIMGIVKHQGNRALATVDLGAFLGMSDHRAVQRQNTVQESVSLRSTGFDTKRILVIQTSKYEVGILCDQAFGIIEVADSGLNTPSVIRGDALRKYLIHEIDGEFGLVGVLDIHTLLDDARVR